MANRIVSKKELEESGASSLREFLNKERNLTMKPPEETKFGKNVMRPTADARAAMNAQDNANRGLDENGQPLQRTANYVPRDQYTSSGKATVDKQDAMAKRDASMSSYMPRRDSMKHGGAVKKMASGGSASSRADGIAQRGKTRGKVC
jgi:hypothetical protein